MFRRILWATPALAVLFALAAWPAEARQPKVYRISGAGRDAKGKLVPQDLLTRNADGVSMSIGYLDAAARGAALASVPGLPADLFPEASENGSAYLVFVLELGYQGQGDLMFEPGQGRLITDRQDAEFPMDYTAIYGLLTKRGPGAPSLDEVERAVFSRSATIKQGGSVRKLLVFPAPRDGKFKRLEVRLGALQIPDGELDAKFEFRKFEVKP